MAQGLRSGDDEGSLEVIIENEARELVIILNLLISGLSDAKIDARRLCLILFQQTQRNILIHILYFVMLQRAKFLQGYKLS